MFVIRIQLFGTFFKNPYPSRLHVIIYAIIFFLCGIVVLIICYNSLGSLIGVIGACFGFILMYFVPIIINVIYYRRKHPPLKLIKEIESVRSERSERKSVNDNKFESEDNPTTTSNSEIVINSNKTEMSIQDPKYKRERLISNFEKQYTNNEDLDLKDKFIYTGKDRNLTKDYLFYFGQALMLGIGLATLIFQFFTLNVFNVILKN